MPTGWKLIAYCGKLRGSGRRGKSIDKLKLTAES
jgi:hypothetical protein